jgi:SAM-dependent methyltransferase
MTEVKKELENGLEYDEEGMRMSTPIEIARYKSKRLKSDTIADIGCGIGVQAIHFSFNSKKVTAVEKDDIRYEIALRNAVRAKADNIEFIKGDAFDPRIVKSVRGVDTVHSDPSRIKSGNLWSLEMLSPNPLRILNEYDANAFSFDLPVHLKIENLSEEWEKEFISIRGEPKRISAYAGKAKKYDLSVITLPSNDRIIRNNELERKFSYSENVKNYIYEIDQGIVLAGLIPEYLKNLKNTEPILFDSQRSFLTSDSMIVDNFILNTYEILAKCEDIQDLKNKIRKLKIGKVIIRFSIPDNLYYNTRRILEKDAIGENIGYIFKIGNFYYIGRKII